MPELAVILVNRNGKAALARCLISLRESVRGKGWEVIIADNASDDGSPDVVSQDFPAFKLMRTGGNLGFARANNIAWNTSRAPFVLFLNPDTVVPPGSLDLLLEEMKRNPGVGASGPLLVRDGDRPQVSFGGRVSFFRELLQRSLLNPYYKRRLKSLRRPREVTWVSGACLLARREAIEQAGGFDERFFLYFEDIDLCLRIAAQGWKILFLPQVSVFHEGGAAARQFARSRLEYRRSQLLFYKKHNSGTSLRLLRGYLRLNIFLLGLGIVGGQGRTSDSGSFRKLLQDPETKP
jgi:GT2 family glycosyltransferase